MPQRTAEVNSCPSIHPSKNNGMNAIHLEKNPAEPRMDCVRGIKEPERKHYLFYFKQACLLE